MKKVDLTQKILKEVVSFEKRKTWFWITRNAILFILFSAFTLFFFWAILIALRETQALGLLGILGEDREVIQLHWGEVAETIFNEVPTEFFVALLVTIVLAVFVIMTVIRGSGKVSRKLREIRKYFKNGKKY